ncbi:MAG: VOC family protein [candidate division Zixibacteria bacterium]|jgi:predicted 3-demethylubiquinone-9 3-methyltransferase (glyoxalase superfamily)|nr:VOC family protein [candidate division Zixibacteria bacterium]
MQRVTPFLWFDGQAEEAAQFYTSIFKDSKIKHVSRYGEGAPVPAGTVMTVSFLLFGQEFVALNGGPQFKFSPAVSLLVRCESQEEVDHYWDRLLDGGQAMACGWLTDKYGLAWQIIPAVFMDFIQDKDQAKVNRVMQAMMQMVKLDIAALRAAYDGK